MSTKEVWGDRPGGVDAEDGSTGFVVSDIKQEYGVPSMFSAATFFDVVDQAPPMGSVGLGEPSAPLGKPVVVAFYGLKGGAGRTLALAHTAAMLARRGLSIVAVDLDIEAPGLHAALGLKLPKGTQGSVELLRMAVTLPPAEQLPALKYLLAANVPDSPGRLLVLPAGAITKTYLAQIEELGLGLWHAHSRSPLRRLVDDLSAQQQPDAIFLDCRTGFSGLSATALFHLADLAVIFLPISEQIWEGAEILMDAARAARSHRANRPALLFVPSMVPASEEGRAKVDKFIQRLRQVYGERLADPVPALESYEPNLLPAPWLEEGISYDQRISIAGCVEPALLRLGAWGIYKPLEDRLADMLPASKVAVLPGDSVDTRRALAEMGLDSDLVSSEDVDIKKLVSHFVAPKDLKRAVDLSTALVVGAKGSGKTWLWRYLVNGQSGPINLPKGVSFLAGHAPDGDEGQEFQLSADAFKELEKACDMRQRGTHKAFWLLYALGRIGRRVPSLLEPLQAELDWRSRPLLEELLSPHDPLASRDALRRILERPDASTLAEELFARADQRLSQARSSLCLVYDGLDTGFQTGRTADWRERQDRFVTALLLVVAEWRMRLKCLYFKVFLREDIYLGVEKQSRSHLDAARHELRWQPEDLWRLALNIASTSETYLEWIRSLLPGVEKPWPVEEGKLRRLLFLLWGERVENSQNTYTADYILMLMSDAAGRFFPRTLGQMLHSAIDSEREGSLRTSPDRIIGHPALRHGITQASKKHVEDLKAEYVELAPYLDAMKGMSFTGTEQHFIKHMRQALEGASRRKTRDFSAVIKSLREVGVLGIHRHGDGKDPERLAVARLYCPGLGIEILSFR